MTGSYPKTEQQGINGMIGGKGQVLGTAAGKTSVVNATDTTFAYEARSSVSILVDLWAPWCGPCRVIGPMLENLSKEYAGRIKVVKVNVDENPALAQQFGATSIPTMVVIKGDRVVDRIVGHCHPTSSRCGCSPT